MQSDDSAPSTYANRGRNQAEDPPGQAWNPINDVPQNQSTTSCKMAMEPGTQVENGGGTIPKEPPNG